MNLLVCVLYRCYLHMLPAVYPPLMPMHTLVLLFIQQQAVGTAQQPK